MPSELIDLAGEIVVWGILGIVLFAQFSHIGSEMFGVSSRATLGMIARHIAATINIVGSRKVTAFIELPGASLFGVYIVVLSGRRVVVESSRESSSYLALYPCASKVLESNHRYLVHFSSGLVVFEEG